MQMPSNLNEQQTWGGQCYQPVSTPTPTVTNEQDQPTLLARGTQDLQVHPLSQARVIASSSDNLFHPVPIYIPTIEIARTPSPPLTSPFEPHQGTHEEPIDIDRLPSTNLFLHIAQLHRTRSMPESGYCDHC